jgi:sugar/nucleoside kinase (ribokinase family)
MARAGVDASRVTPRAGATGCCVILSVGRERTMRTCLEGAARMDVSEVDSVTFAGARFAFLSAYLLYAPGLLEAAAAAARAAGARVALDLGSFEVVRAFLPQLAALLDAGAIDVVFCNEEEAAEIARGLARPDADGDSAADGGADGGAAAPAAALALLAARARELAVVTLGAAGCLVQPRGGAAAIARPAHPVDAVRDTTGAGDLFAAGFLRALLCGAAPADAADAGCLAGAAVVRTVGAEMAPEDWAWLRSRAGAAAK